MRLPILLLTLAGMASATIYWKHSVSDERKEVEYQLFHLKFAINNLKLLDLLADRLILFLPEIIKMYATGNAGYIVSASKTADGGLVATGASTGTDIVFYFKWKLNSQSPTGYKLVECRACPSGHCYPWF